MLARGPNLVFNEIEIVEKPFRRRGNATFLFRGRRHQFIRPNENRLVFVQTRNERVGQIAGGDLMGARQAFGMAFELFDVKQLVSQRLFIPLRQVIPFLGLPPGHQSPEFIRDNRNGHQILFAAAACPKTLSNERGAAKNGPQTQRDECSLILLEAANGGATASGGTSGITTFTET